MNDFEKTIPVMEVDGPIGSKKVDIGLHHDSAPAGLVEPKPPVGAVPAEKYRDTSGPIALGKAKNSAFPEDHSNR